MATRSNKVDGLNWQVPIVDASGKPTPEFQRKWEQQRSTNGTIPDLTTAKAVSAVFDVIGTVAGAMLVRGGTQWGAVVPAADGRVLRDKGAGNAAIWDTISNVLDTIANTRGGLLYRGVAGWAVLAPSAAGKVLTDGGVGADPSWQAASSGGGAASCYDDGTNFYVALSDADGQLVLDGAGDPVFVKEVFPAAAIPYAPANPTTTASDTAVNGTATTFMRSDAAPAIQKATNAAFGLAKGDGSTISAVAGLLSAVGLPAASVFSATLSVSQPVTSSTYTQVLFNNVIVDTQGAYNPATGLYTAKKAGRYLAIGMVAGNCSTGQGEVDTVVNIGGVTVAHGVGFGVGAGTQSGTTIAAGIGTCNGTTDTINILGWTAGSGTVLFSANLCSLAIIYLGP